MKNHVWDELVGSSVRLPASRRTGAKRKSVAEILRAAYRRHVRDTQTQLAVRRGLR